MKSKIDRLDIGKLKTTPTDLSKLSNVVKNEVIKKTEYDDLVRNVTAIDTSKLANKADSAGKIKDIEDKIPDITKLATIDALNAKINEVKDKIPSITNLAATDVFTAIEDKIPDVSDLVKKKNRL